MLYLKLANLEDTDAEYEALQKIPKNENGLKNKYFGMSKQKFVDKGLPKIIADTSIPPTKSYVPQSYYFLWDDNRIVGWFKFRHQLCERLRENGGHIGYVIIPEYRGKSYATKGLELLLDKVRDIIPEDEFWLFAHKDNLASQKVMLANGAYKVSESIVDGIPIVQMRIKKEKRKMEKTFDFLKHKAKVNDEPVNYVSTLDQGLPTCRPFGDPVLYDERIYVLTMKHKSVSKQLAENDHACIVAYDGENWIRINCRMLDDSDNLEAKRAVIAEFDWAEEAGYTLDNPDFQLLYIAEAKAECRDCDGELIWSEKF